MSDPRETPRTRKLAMIAPADRDRFAEHAAPEAIEVYLQSARKQRDQWDQHAAWLRNLLEQRRQQVVDGTWPGPKEKPDAT